MTNREDVHGVDVWAKQAKEILSKTLEVINRGRIALGLKSLEKLPKGKSVMLTPVALSFNSEKTKTPSRPQTYFFFGQQDKGVLCFTRPFSPKEEETIVKLAETWDTHVEKGSDRIFVLLPEEVNIFLWELKRGRFPFLEGG